MIELWNTFYTGIDRHTNMYGGSGQSVSERSHTPSPILTSRPCYTLDVWHRGRFGPFTIGHGGGDPLRSDTLAKLYNYLLKTKTAVRLV